MDRNQFYCQKKDNYICGYYTVKKTCSDSSLKLCQYLSLSAEAESRCRGTQCACAFKWSSPNVVLSRGCWKHNSNFQSLISRPLKRISTFGGLHNSTTMFQLSQWMQGSVVEEDEQEKQRAFMLTLAVNLGFFFLVEDCFEFNKNITF